MSHAKPGGVEGDAMMTVRFPGGTVAHVCTSQRMGGRYGWLDLLGSKGRIHAEWESNVLTIQSQVVDAYKNLTHIEVPVAAYLPAPAAGARASLASHAYIRMWAAELGEFAAAITQGRDPAVTGEDGVRVLQVTDAAFESARSSKPVDVK
jgi:predicted dehydrogenase